MNRTDEKTRSPLGSPLLPAVAYGLFLLCTSTILWGGHLALFENPEASSWFAASYFACMLALPLGFASAAIFAYIKPSARAWRSIPVALCLALLSGVLLIARTRIENNWLTDIAIGGLFGFSGALFFCNLQEIVASRKVFDCGIIVFLAAAISATGGLLAEATGNMASWASVFVFIPVVSMLCMHAQQSPTHLKHPMFQTIPKHNNVKLKNALDDLWRPFLCVSFSAFLIGIIRADGMIDGGMLEKMNNSNMLGLIVASIVLLAFWRSIYEKALLSKLHMIMFPLIATAFLLLPFLSATSRDVFASFAFTVFSITSSLMVVSCARTARMYAVSPILVYGTFASLVYLSLACGALISFFLGGLHNTETLWLFAIALVAIYILSMALTVGKRPFNRARQKNQSSVTQAIEQTDAFANNSPTSNSAIKKPEKKVLSGNPSSTFAEPSLDDRCAGIAQTYSLTPREAQVMTLLAHGRDVAFMSDELTLSKNTVRTHVKNVFAKTNVHSKQELIDLVYLFEL